MDENSLDLVLEKLGSDVIPRKVFSAGGLDFVYRLRKPGAERMLAIFLDELSEKPTRQMPPTEFIIESRGAKDNDILIVIALPCVTELGKRSFVGIRFDHKTVGLGLISAGMSESPNNNPMSRVARVLNLKAVDQGWSILLETNASGAPSVHGFADVNPSADAMFSILERLGPVTEWRQPMPITPWAEPREAWRPTGETVASLGAKDGQGSNGGVISLNDPTPQPEAKPVTMIFYLIPRYVIILICGLRPTMITNRPHGRQLILVLLAAIAFILFGAVALMIQR